MQFDQTTDRMSEQQARRMFRAVLAPWAMDMLSLRRRGLDRPSRRYQCGLVLRPGAAGVQSGPLRRAA